MSILFHRWSTRGCHVRFASRFPMIDPILDCSELITEKVYTYL